MSLGVIGNRPIFQDTRCGFCWEDYNTQENRCTVLACGHLFHTNCVELLVQNIPQCPLCQREIRHIASKGCLRKSLNFGVEIFFITFIIADLIIFGMLMVGPFIRDAKTCPAKPSPYSMIPMASALIFGLLCALGYAIVHYPFTKNTREINYIPS